MIAAVLNTKGGVGKTTLALNLAVGRVLQGSDVWLIDGDRQATASQAIAQRAESNQQQAIAISHYTDGPLLRSQIKQQGSKYDDIVIDAGGRDSTVLRAALLLADVVIVPFLPRSFDVWGVGDLAELVAEAASMRDSLRVWAVLNGADPRGGDNREAAQAVADYPLISYLNAPIGRRKAIAEAAGAGLSVLETGGNGKAKAEIGRLLEAVFSNHFDIGSIAG